MAAQEASSGFSLRSLQSSEANAQKILHFEDLFLNNNFAMEIDEIDVPNNNNNNNNANNNDNNNNDNNLDVARGIDNHNANYSIDENANHQHACWVFAYGSLCWHPGFKYSKCLTGYIKGYVRRFWQGNIAHRGTVEKPGRVATLVPEKEGITWGCAYQITGDDALEYLKQRECKLGGYATLETKFYPRVASYDTPFGGEAIYCVLYIATPENPHWLGEDPNHQIAEDIAICRGDAGHNAEYLLRLATFMHKEIPDAMDEHLFELEYLVLKELEQRDIPLWSVMGTREYGLIRRDSHENIRKPLTFEFTSRVVDKKLRCLNI